MLLPLMADRHRTTRKANGYIPAFLTTCSILLSGCFLSPAVNSGDYRNKAGNSARAMVSVVQSATYAVTLDLEGKSTGALTNNLVSDAEMDAGSIITAFDSRQPPNRESIKLMQSLDDPLQEASTELTALRIAVREGDRSGMSHAVRALQKPLRAFSRLEDLSS